MKSLSVAVVMRRAVALCVCVGLVMLGVSPACGATWSQMTLTHVSSQYADFDGTAYDASKLFDNSASTKWCSYLRSDGANWVEFTASVGVPSRLVLVAADDTTSYSSRNWKSWTLFGLQGSSWVTIKSWSNQSPSMSAGSTTTYDFSNDKAYPKYKVVLHAIASGTREHQMADLKLYTDTSRSSVTVNCSDWAMAKANLEAGNSVKLTQDVSQNSTCSIPANTGAMTLDLNGYTIYRTASSQAFYVNSGNTFTLRNGTFDGQNYTFYADGHFMASSGTTTLDGVTIKRCANNGGTSWYGTVYVPRGSVTMKGGALQNCTTTGNGGGFYVSGTGVLTMTEGAVIEGCSSTCMSDNTGGGAVYVKGSGTFNFMDGTIRNCTASKNGGGVYVVSGTNTMSGGVITNCTASSWGGGVMHDNGVLTLNDGLIGGCKAATGGGVFSEYGASASFTMNGGTVSGNSASGYGGGMYVRSLFKMYGGTVCNNTASGGTGGLHLENSTHAKAICGGVVVGNKTTASGSRPCIASWSTTTTITGLVCDVEPTQANFMSGGTLTVAPYAKVGSLWVVGNAIVSDANGRLTAGTYTFNPTNAEYVAAGVVDPAKAVVTGMGASYALRAEGIADCNTAAMLKSNLEAGNSVKLVQDVTNAAPIRVGGGRTQTVDLGGHNLVAGDEGRFFVVSDGGSLTISGGGTIDGNGFTCASSGQLAYVDSTNATLTVSGVTVQNMRSADCGGAICVSNGVLTVTNATIRACSAASYGGGICNFNGTLQLDDSAIEDCTSAKGGGAVYNQMEN